MTILAEPIAAPAEQTTTMKPSEALRLGSLTTEQAFGIGIDSEGRLCALATIATVDEDAWWFLFHDGTARCPVCREGRSAFWTTEHLNDVHRWTRPQIADWLEGIGL